MRTLGLIGGMSWESSAEYYRIINQQIRSRLGGQHSARLLLYSVDFADIERMQREGDWAAATVAMIDAAQRLQRGGADCLLLCTNTMHKLAPAIEAACPLPLLHIADAAGRAVAAAGLRRVGLLGTRFTMEQGFLVARLRERHGLDVPVPPPAAREDIHRIIYDELCRGRIHAASRARFVDIMQAMADDGAEGFILGCTEIPLLVTQGDAPWPLFDTTRLHAECAVDFALGG